MKEIIRGYEIGCELVKKRASELRAMLAELRKNGGEEKITELDLERRIYLLTTEYRQANEIMKELVSCMRRAG